MPSASPKTPLKVFTLAEVETSSSRQNVLIVIHDKIYNVTDFLDEHPGGDEILIDKSGSIATEDFEDMGHSTDARELMAKYLVGEVAEEDKKYTKEKVIDWSSSDFSSSKRSNSWTLLATMVCLLAALVYFYTQSS